MGGGIRTLVIDECALDAASVHLSKSDPKRCKWETFWSQRMERSSGFNKGITAPLLVLENFKLAEHSTWIAEARSFCLGSLLSKESRTDSNGLRVPEGGFWLLKIERYLMTSSLLLLPSLSQIGFGSFGGSKWGAIFWGRQKFIKKAINLSIVEFMIGNFTEQVHCARWRHPGTNVLRDHNGKFRRKIGGRSSREFLIRQQKVRGKSVRTTAVIFETRPSLIRVRNINWGLGTRSVTLTFKLKDWLLLTSSESLYHLQVYFLQVKINFLQMKFNFLLLKINFLLLKINFLLLKIDFLLLKINFLLLKINFLLLKINFLLLKINFLLLKINFLLLKINFLLLKINFLLLKIKFLIMYEFSI